ncbi:hypothetical protein [Denitromonas ohlonensis]|uniref:DUF4386 domain-containing protein n=2 Tax=Denitromonas TaxID=139331 RepID=A0A557RED9_9RHOO|nr:hypothetical protein [Denitromonas ohlonensis]TVO63522.1 hypothetical protein FHP90_13650 [Denitromonas ohlonensis]TVO75399.1 hypothetical protein FHP89_13685 [Denitromonas ohlonensis]TVT70602.1 MAG: hypothetical protein FHP92_17925 [Denitromonas halophila]
MDENTKILYQKLSLYSGPFFVITFIIFWAWLGQNLPPPHPDWPAQAFSDRYVDHLTGIRVGFLVSLITICFYLPWTGYVTARMMRIETGRYPVLSYLQLMGGCLTVMVVSISMWCWVVAAQRPERSPEITQMLTDAGWLMNDTVYMCTALQMFAMALCFLADKKSTIPVMPNWACYLTIFCGATFFPASLTAILRDGPFAYDGLIGYWLPYPAWLIWLFVATYYLLADLKRRARTDEGKDIVAPIVNQMLADAGREK